MPGIHKRREAFVSLVDENTKDYLREAYDPNSKDLYCQHCASYGFYFVRLGQRLYQQSELLNGQVPSDHDNWIQCYRCGNIIAKIHARNDNSEIVGIKEVPNSPYEKDNKPTILPKDNDSTARRKIKKIRNSRVIRGENSEEVRQIQNSLSGGEENDIDVQNFKKKGYTIKNYQSSL